MDRQGFRTLLQTRKLNEEQVEASISIAERFKAFINESGRVPSAGTAWEFSRLLIKEASNTEENYIALVRYCLFIKDQAMYVALLELVDGGEVGDNLYRQVAERFGRDLRDEVFAGIGIAPFGTPTPDKPSYLHPVIFRLEAIVGEKACRDFLSNCLRDLPNENYLQERKIYHQTGDIDAYLRRRKQAFVDQLKACLHEGRPFFAQEITAEVIAYVRSDPEMGGGLRKGNVIYETKIPYMTKQYLAGTDPALKRYYYCHCPWVREAVKNGDVRLSETFCNCSAGFHKKTFEVIFEQPLIADVLESIIKGDERCRFAIHLPGGAITKKEG